MTHEMRTNSCGVSKLHESVERDFIDGKKFPKQWIMVGWVMQVWVGSFVGVTGWDWIGHVRVE